VRIPATGRDPGELLGELDARAAGDVDWRGGRVFSLVYHAGPAHEDLVARAHTRYASTNLLNPLAFASLRRLERELVEMVAELMHGDASTVGTVTSGGTESILCAVAAYRDRARRTRPWIRRPELVVPRTIHPAFDKAAHYFGVRLVKVDVGPDLRADVRAMARAISWRTIGLVGSAPQYPHGVVDPIADLGALALRRRLPLHVDACVGGFVLPWLERLGRTIPRWDFRVPGVTSISADLHKFGYAAKGASVLLWRRPRDLRDQIFVATDWPGGIYASPTLLGTRPGGPIAGAWAALQALGEDGYLELARRASDAADRLRAGIAAIPQLAVLGRGDATIVAYGAVGLDGRDSRPAGSAAEGRRGFVAGRDSRPAGSAAEGRRGVVDVFALADRLEARGWSVDRQHRPACIHLTVTANHAQVVDAYLADLRAAVAELRAAPGLARDGQAAMYGMAATFPLRRLVASRVRAAIAELYRPPGCGR
jgi:glutamate/tyrosine decarboxylase-like PLP-dependent enzyme